MPLISIPSWFQMSMVNVCNINECGHLPQACSESELQQTIAGCQQQEFGNI